MPRLLGRLGSSGLLHWLHMTYATVPAAHRCQDRCQWHDPVIGVVVASCRLPLRLPLFAWCN